MAAGSEAADGEPAAERRFGRLVEAFEGRPGVTGPGEAGGRGFGSGALKVDGSIFAMLPRGELILKLPASRVTALIADGTGRPFTAGKATAMREWLTVAGDEETRWRELAEEAYAFVRSRSGAGRSVSRSRRPAR